MTLHDMFENNFDFAEKFILKFFYILDNQIFKYCILM